MTEPMQSPDQQRSSRVIRVVQSAGIIIAGAYLVLAFTRYPQLTQQVLLPGVAGAVALIGAFMSTVKARVAYWLFLSAAAVTLLDLADGYIHALFFLGSFLILGALAAINEPDDQEALTIKRLMEEE